MRQFQEGGRATGPTAEYSETVSLARSGATTPDKIAFNLQPLVAKEAAFQIAQHHDVFGLVEVTPQIEAALQHAMSHCAYNDDDPGLPRPFADGRDQAVRDIVSELWFETEILADTRPHRVIRDAFACFVRSSRYTEYTVEMADVLGFVDREDEGEIKSLDAYDLDAELRFAAASMDVMETFICDIPAKLRQQVRNTCIDVHQSVALLGGGFDWSEELFTLRESPPASP